MTHVWIWNRVEVFGILVIQLGSIQTGSAEETKKKQVNAEREDSHLSDGNQILLIKVDETNIEL